MSDKDTQEIGKLRWKCRRGMKELDVLLEGYLKTQDQTASEAEQGAFRALLDEQDPVLYAYVMGRGQPAAEDQRRVIESLRRAP